MVFSAFQSTKALRLIVISLQAYSRLCDPELICLKREIAVSKGQTVECMAVRHFEEDNVPKVEVWVGSGQADDNSAQVAIIDLCDKGVEVKSIVNRHRMFSRDFTVAMLLSLNKGTAAMLMSQTNLRELNSAIMQTFSFVLVEKHSH